MHATHKLLAEGASGVAVTCFGFGFLALNYRRALQSIVGPFSILMRWLPLVSVFHACVCVCYVVRCYGVRFGRCASRINPPQLVCSRCSCDRW